MFRQWPWREITLHSRWVISLSKTSLCTWSRFPWFHLYQAYCCPKMQGWNRTSVWLLQIIVKLHDTGPWTWNPNVSFSYPQVHSSWLPHSAKEEETECRRVTSVERQVASLRVLAESKNRERSCRAREKQWLQKGL